MELSLWHRLLYRFIRGLYFHRIQILFPDRLPKSGPRLYLCLHRNGAVDGFVYNRAVPRAVPIISTQLRRGALGRAFFAGIELTRAKDAPSREGHPDNAGALDRALGHLAAGGELSIFPEGTSSLGPRHLPFKAGAAHLILRALEGGLPLTVIPLGVHYERAWSFQANVEIVVGEPVSLSLPDDLRELGRLKELRARIQTALETVGVNVPSVRYQEDIERLAYTATLATPRSYFLTLKSLERAIPERVLRAWEALKPELDARGLLRHQGVPLFPLGRTWAYGLAWLALAPLTALAAALNAVPLAAGGWAGKRFPDGVNVVSLWKILVGVPAFLIWFCGVMALAWTAGRPGLSAGYALATLLGLGLYYRAKKLTVAVVNGLRHPGLRQKMLDFRDCVLHELPEETTPRGESPCCPPILPGLLPHEPVFGLFLVLTWLRLAHGGGLARPDSLAFLALIFVNAALIAWCSAAETPLRWRLRLLFYPLAMNAAYLLMRTAVPAFHPGLEDAALQTVDGWLAGGNLSLRLQPLVCPPATEVMSFCYILFMPYLMFSMLWYFLGDLKTLKRFYAGLFTLYGLGFLGYSLVPALGPHLAMADRFTASLNGGWITALNAKMVLTGSNRVDVFPSLHCAVSSYFLFFDRKHKPLRYKCYLVPCAGLWLSTIYLRYHYFVDVVCGFGLAAFSLWMAERLTLEEDHVAPAQVR